MKIIYQFDTTEGEEGYHEHQLAKVYSQSEDMYYALYTIRGEIMRSMFVKERWAEILYEELKKGMPDMPEEMFEQSYRRAYDMFEALLRPYQEQLDEVLSGINLDLMP